MNSKITIPRPEYPRPQMVRADWLNLNGLWEFEMDPGRSGEERGLHCDETYTRTITVPFPPESELSGIGHKDFMPCVWYRRSFQVPEEWDDKRVLLHCGAVDYEATVWINGQSVGSHRGGYSPFCFDISDHLKPGENTIAVRAVDDTRSALQPSGKQCAAFESQGCSYTRTTGIWQTVWLEAVPPTHLQSFRFYPDVDGGTVTIHANITGEAEGCTLCTTVLASGELVGSASVAARGSMAFTIDLSEIRPWSLDDPFLYDVDFSLDRGGQQIDRVESYFGLRQIDIQGKKVLINNQSVFQRLVLDQGFYPDGIYTAPSDEALRNDIEISQALGFNGARLHQKVFEPRFLYWADRLGYLCWGEYPNWGIDHSNPAALERVLSEWLEVLQRDFNHPCIIGWCAFNETPTSQNPELLRSIYRVTKAIDPTRPVLDTSGYTHIEDTDVYDCHNYQPDPERLAADFEEFKTKDTVWHNHPEEDAPYQGQPYFNSEYGGIWWNPGQMNDRAWGYGERPQSEEEFLERYRGLTEVLLFHPRMFGFCYTQLYDIEQEVNGLYTYDRKPKFDPAIIKAINSQPAAIEEESEGKAD